MNCYLGPSLSACPTNYEDEERKLKKWRPTVQLYPRHPLIGWDALPGDERIRREDDVDDSFGSMMVVSSPSKMSAMLAAHLILHPQLTRSLKVLATTVGRDKVRPFPFPPDDHR